MVISRTTLELFAPYQREVGKYRRQIYTVDEFQDYIRRASGSEEAFVSVLPTDGTVDRAHFDLDGPSAIHDGKLLYAWGVTNSFCTIPLLTGKKGIQVHFLSKPFRVPNPKEVLGDIEAFILNQALGLHSWDDVSAVDFHLFANPSAMCRIPETLRPPENTAYCSYLPPNFCELSETEIFRFAKYPYVFPYTIHHRKSLLELPFANDPQPIRDNHTSVEPHSRPQITSPIIPSDVLWFLSNLLTPKRMSEITMQNPPHHTRVVTTIELLDAGLTVEEILSCYSRLGWTDYNERITLGYLNDLAKRYYSGQYHFLGAK